ncbi:MAG: hypothetical protein HOV79_32300 [Hamadaea sp.]|nr:hypothetical protein [Hamadaea sp.]
MGYRIQAPLFLGPREAAQRLPSVQVGDDVTGGVVSCGLTFTGRDLTWWRLLITVRARAVYDEPQAIGVPANGHTRSRQAREVLGSAMSFLLSDAQAYRRTMGVHPPPDGWCFNAAVAEWANLNDDALQVVAGLLAG